MKEVGIVDKVEDIYATVRILKKSACGENCSSCCGGCVPTERSIVARNSAFSEIGDRVILEIKDSRALKAAFIVYILPIIVFFALYFICGVFWGNEAIKVMIAILGIVIILPLLKIYDAKHKEKYMAEIIEKIN